MKISYSFRHVDPSEGVKKYAADKIGRLQKFLRSPLSADVTISKERHLHQVSISVTGDGVRYAGTEESEDTYASIDLCIDKIDRQVREAKSTVVAKRRTS